VHEDSGKDRAASERVERVARVVQERARRLEILDRRALARRKAEDRRLQQAGRR
jgi:hypothetical protein